MNHTDQNGTTKRSGKAQISGMLILAILMIFMFAALTYIVTTFFQDSGEQTVVKGQLSEAELSPIKQHVQDCLDLASRNGLALAGAQGGVIYRSQGGATQDPNQADFGESYLTYEGKNVPYAIIPAVGSLGSGDFIYETEPPAYPWQGFPEYQEPCGAICPPLIRSTQGLTGYNLLTHLPKLFSISMQDQLERYILNRTLTCIDWGQFKNRNLEITKGPASVNVSIESASTSVIFEYPLDVLNTATGTQGTMREFTLEYPVRLGQMLQFTSDTIDADSTDLAFNMTASIAENLTFERKKDVKQLDYIIITTDPHSSILETPYELRFAIRNRRPALYLLNDTEHRDVNTFVLCGEEDEDGNYHPPKLSISGEPRQFCIQNPPGCSPRSMCAPLQSLDPDDNPITYTYNLEPPESTPPTSGEIPVSESTLHFLQNNQERIGITVNVTDGQLADSQTLNFKVLCISCDGS